MTYYHSNLGDIFYFYRKAAANKETLLFIPSFGGDNTYYNFKNIIDKIDDSYGILAIDPIGNGYSHQSAMTRNITNIVKNYLDVTQSLSIEKIVIISHSLGALYALALIDTNLLNISHTILIEPPHLGIENELRAEMGAFLVQLETINNLKAQAEISYEDFLNSVNPLNPLPDRTNNAKLLYETFGNTSIISEATNQDEVINFLVEIKEELPALPFTLICSNNRQLEYEVSQYQSVGAMIFMEGTHFLHWSNESAFLVALNTILTSL